MHDYRQLKVWKRAHDLALSVYHQTAEFPRHERYGLTSQLRRAAGSIPANLAEGSGRRSPTDFARFIDYSVGSSMELEYELILAADLGYLPATIADHLVAELGEIRGMLRSLADRCRRTAARHTGDLDS